MDYFHAQQHCIGDSLRHCHGYCLVLLLVLSNCEFTVQNHIVQHTHSQSSSQGMYRNATYTNTVHERGALMWAFLVQFLLFTSTFTHMVIAAIPTAETGKKDHRCIRERFLTSVSLIQLVTSAI